MWNLIPIEHPSQKLWPLEVPASRLHDWSDAFGIESFTDGDFLKIDTYSMLMAKIAPCLKLGVKVSY